MPSLNSLMNLGWSGLGWYARAKDKIEARCLESGWNAEEFTAALAITSPRVHVSRNWALACEWMEHGTVTGCLSQTREALHRYEETGVVSGPKVGAFYRALLGDGDAVVIDSWIMRAYNLPRDAPNVGDRVRIDASIRRLARKHRISAADAQAVLWTGIMVYSGRLKGLNF